MNAQFGMRQYQRQATLSSSPEQLIAKLFDLGVQSCYRGDQAKVRAVLVELMSSINFEHGGEIAQRLYALYEFCLLDVSKGNLDNTREILEGLRDAWKKGVIQQKAA